MIKKWVKITNKKGQEYDVLIVLNEQGQMTENSSCSCMWGSFHRWSQVNRKDKFMCRHMIQAYAKLTKQEPRRAREVLVKQGICNKEHLIKI